MNYSRKSFTVATPGTKSYADNWERTFRGEAAPDVWEGRWTGPNWDDWQPGENMLKAAVPPERWPYGPPDHHQDACILHKGGLYCDCEASAHDDVEWGKGA